MLLLHIHASRYVYIFVYVAYIVLHKQTFI